MTAFPFRLSLSALALSALLAGCASNPSREGKTAQVSDTLAAADTVWRIQPGDPGGLGSPSGDSGAATAAQGPSKPGSPSPGAGSDGRSPAAQTGSRGVPGRSGEVARKPGADSGAGQVTVKTEPPPSPAPPRTEPLIMENADRMEGSRSRGEYILIGKVRFTHGALRLETERAVWLKDRSLIYAESGMRIVHRGALLTSDRGSYDKNLGQATAEGKVRMRDSSGEVEANANNVTYLRYKHLATLTGNPVVRRFYRKAPDSAGAADSLARGMAAPGAVPGAIIDTLTIKGTVLTYDDSAQVATADGNVIITRKQVNITCKKAEYRDQNDSLYLTGEPAVNVDESRVTGVSMRVGMNGEEIKSLLVKGDAQARSVEPATDTSAARMSDIAGDSLFMAFRDKSIDSVQVFHNAKGSYFDQDKPDYVNKMSGEYMVLRFVEKKINSANVLGGAKSTYFHLEKKKLKGRNEAEGDTIDFAFKDGKVDEVMVRGKAKGTYFGDAPTPKGQGDSAAAPDSARAPAGGAPAPAGGAPAPQPPPGAAAGPAAAPSKPEPAAPGAAEREEIDRSKLPNNPWRRK